jgi:hypothetical protein
VLFDTTPASSRNHGTSTAADSSPPMMRTAASREISRLPIVMFCAITMFIAINAAIAGAIKNGVNILATTATITALQTAIRIGRGCGARDWM